MPDHLDIVRRYIAAQRDNRIDDALALVADDVVLVNPTLGTFNGKPAVEVVWRTRPARGPGAPGISFGEPVIAGDEVKLPGIGPFGAFRILFAFNAGDLITKVDIGLGT